MDLVLPAAQSENSTPARAISVSCQAAQYQPGPSDKAYPYDT